MIDNRRGIMYTYSEVNCGDRRERISGPTMIIGIDLGTTNSVAASSRKSGMSLFPLD